MTDLVYDTRIPTSYIYRHDTIEHEEYKIIETSMMVEKKKLHIRHYKWTPYIIIDIRPPYYYIIIGYKL